jgi:hypothetical protein
MNVGIGTVAAQFLFWDVCFEFSVLGLYRVVSTQLQLLAS